MNRKQLRTLGLAVAGLNEATSNYQLARQLGAMGIAPSGTVYNWLQGRSRVPRLVDVHLDLIRTGVITGPFASIQRSGKGHVSAAPARQSEPPNRYQAPRQKRR